MAHDLTRPMPPSARRTLLEQYRGRRRMLAAAAHAYLTFYEHHEGFAIDWRVWQVSDAFQTVQTPYPQFTTAPQCLCEEDFLTQILWHMVSQEPLEKEPIFRYVLGQRVRLRATGWRGTVVQRRRTERDTLGPLVEYLVQCATGTGWEHEPDLLGEHEEPLHVACP